MKQVTLQPLNDHVSIKTEANLLEALLANKLDVIMACKGRGLCATCLVHVTAGQEQLTPMTDVEKRRLGRITTTKNNSRLACQARVMGDGVVVEVPEGMYMESVQDLMALVGRRAEQDILNPISGEVLIAAGKLITRSKVQTLESLEADILELRNKSSDRL
ncbi:MAG: 2Fe-2S iron-sulfur cluster binding domain-containing protein [Candidatus Sericytochromatia bacterium]|nr:2Fe-2S iron-sulfur cluster binding domain-containing protein [Candidatus Sericytochromatia bacterium]